MFGLHTDQPVDEASASGAVDLVYHEARQVLRASGVGLLLRTWASHERFLEAIWQALAPSLGTVAFEDAADRLRREAARRAAALGRLNVASAAHLGESQSYQVRQALALYRYVAPKLVLAGTAALACLERGPLGGAGAGAGVTEAPARLPRGVPAGMYPMDLLDERPDDARLQALFDDMRASFGVEHVDDLYRTLARWPRYLEVAWARLRPQAAPEGFAQAADALGALARQLADALPGAVPLGAADLQALGDDPAHLASLTLALERGVRVAMLHAALLSLDWMDEADAARSPFGLSASVAPAAPPMSAPAASGPLAAASSESPEAGPAPAPDSASRPCPSPSAAPAPAPDSSSGAAGAPAPATDTRAADSDLANWRDWQALQRVAQLGERFLSYVDLGRGEPIVFLHGIPTWGWLWHHQARALAATHRVLVPDLPGFGFSDQADRFDRSIARQAEWIDAWLGQLGVESATVVGHDIGGGVAQRLATLFARRVGRLCLMNVVCYDNWPVEALLQLGHPTLSRKLSPAMLLRGLKLALRAGFAHAPRDGLLDSILAPYATPAGKTSLVRAASSLDTNLTTEIVDRLPGIAAPTLVLWGQADLLLSPRYGERLVRDIPDARFEPIAEAGHFVMLDAPQAVTQRVARFIGASAR